MKKLIIIATGLMMFLGSTAFANWGGGDKKSKKNNSSPAATSLVGASTAITNEISKSFTAKFSSAENVNWTQKDEFYFANFKFKEQNMAAAYNAEGELLAMSRNLKLSQLPLHVEMSIREKYKDCKIDENVTEIVFDGETSYRLQVEDKSRYMQVKCDSYGQTSVLKRIKKKLVGSVY